MDRFPFLSDEWVSAARRIRAEANSGQEVPEGVRLNQVITDVPFGPGTIDAHVDTTSGTLEMELGHVEEPDATVTLDYETARSVFVDGTVAGAMKAFMDGKVRVQGEMAKLLAVLQQLAPADQASVTEVQRRIREVTE